MSDLLFDIPEHLSPRLQWLKDYSVRFNFADDCPNFEWCAWLPENDFRTDRVDGDGIAIFDESLPDNPELAGYGHTLDDAIVEMAKIYGIKLWSEIKHAMIGPVGKGAARILSL